MTRAEKRVILVLAIILVVVIIAVVVMKMGKNNSNELNQNEQRETLEYATQLSDGTKVNTSEELKKTKKYKDLEISNIQYIEKDGKTVFMADVKNTGSEEHAVETVMFNVVDGSDNSITKFTVVIGKIKSGETIKLNANVTADVVNAKDIKIEENK